MRDPQVCMLVFFPWIFENKYVENVRSAYKDFVM